MGDSQQPTGPGPTDPGVADVRAAWRTTDPLHTRGPDWADQTTDYPAYASLDLLARLIGVAYCFYVAKGLGSHLQVFGLHYWGPEALLALGWLPGVLGFVFFLAKRKMVGRVFFALQSLLYPLAVMLWPLVSYGHQSFRAAFWIHEFPALAALSAIIGFGPRIALGFLITACLTVEAVLYIEGEVKTLAVVLVRSLFSFGFAGYFVLMAVVMLRTGHRITQSRMETARTKAARSAVAARTAEVSRLDRLTHDNVLSLLNSAAEGIKSDKLMVQAKGVITDLDHTYASYEGDDELVSVGARIEENARQLGIQASCDCEGSSALPRSTAIEIEAAAAEALRNAERHAGVASASVAIVVRPGRLQVDVVDNGPGFSPEQTGVRLGVRQSILNRMNSLPGGFAAVESAPGVGTAVRIQWHA